MTDGYERGVVVDADGFFVAALRWEAGTPAPKINERATTGGKTPNLVILRDTYAIENVETNARWDFTPVRTTEGALVRAGTWKFPTEKRWVVVQRRDIPDLWFLTGQKFVWPERPPRLPDGSKLIDTAPPTLGRGRKPVWDDVAAQWLAPRRIAVLAADGTIENFVSAYRTDDLPLGVVDMAEFDGANIKTKDEAGILSPPVIGDKITAKDTNGRPTTIVRRIPPRYAQVSVELLEEVLAEKGLASEFVTFVTGKGYTIKDVRNIGNISLNNRLLREFVADQGVTIQQAYNTLQRAIQDKARDERIKLITIAEEE